MKRILLLMLAVLALSPALMASDKKKKDKAKEEASINWLTLDEVQAAMKKKPKKVFMDIYTDWCGWCKVMDKKTFSHPDVIRYMNQNFYAVKVNAEGKDSIHFMGRSFGYVPAQRANSFAVELLQGRMSYPTSVILEENFQNPAAIPGYLDVTMMEKVLKYLGENIYKTKQFPEFEKEFVASWKEKPAPESDPSKK